MTEETIKIFREYQQKGQILSGVIKLTQHSEEFDTDILLLELDEVKAIIKREDFDIKDNGRSLVQYVGRTVKFVIMDITEDGTLICSRKVVKELERELIIQKLEAGEEFEAKIVHLLRFGAYLNIKGTTVVLRNMDFSNDHTTVSDMHKVGDTIKVKLHRVTSTKKILVEAVEKFCNPTAVDFDTFEEEQVVSGRIRTIKTWGCFVCIAPNLDALAQVPELPDFEAEEGMTVLLKIKQVNREEKRIRGKILKVIPDDSLLELD